MNNCHCITCNIIEITYKNKYNLIAQMFLIIIDFDTFRLIDQSKILILFVFIFQFFVIVFFNNQSEILILFVFIFQFFVIVFFNNFVFVIVLNERIKKNFLRCKKM